MAYAAIVSLKQTMQRFLDSFNTTIESSSREIIEFAHKEVKSLQEILERLEDSSSSSSKRSNALDGEIREAVCQFEDVLESHLLNQITSQSESRRDELSSLVHSVDMEEAARQEFVNYSAKMVMKLKITIPSILDHDRIVSQSESHEGEANRLLFTIDLQDLKQEIHSFADRVKKMEEEYIKELDNPLPEEEEEDDDADVSSSIDFGGKMIGFCDEFTFIKGQMLSRMRPYDFSVFPFIGKPGSGRTFVARNIFENLCIDQELSFDCGAGITIGPKYQFKEILIGILAQIDPVGKGNWLISEGDEKLAEYLYTSLKDRKYVIVLDDIWDNKVWDFLRRSFPEQNNGSLVLLTTSLEEVAKFASSYYIFELPVAYEDGICRIFSAAMFGAESYCPPELEEAGKKIAKNCQGLLITLAKVILCLSKTEKKPEYWNKLAADQENSVFMVADETLEIHKISEELQLCNSFPDDEQRTLAAAAVSGIMSHFDSLIQPFKKHMFPKRLFPKIEIVAFVGMAGIGKTTLIKEVFEDPSTVHHFDHRAWVTLGLKYQSKEILVDVLGQMYPDIDKMRMKEDPKLVNVLCRQLSNKRCLIVLDDVRKKEALHYLKELLLDIGGEVLVTTGEKLEECDRVHVMRLLNVEESWHLLRQKVFAKGLCPPELEKAGRKIAENCDGLPLTIIKVADYLSKADKTPEYWKR